MKKCATCCSEKALTEFRASNRRANLDGLTRCCGACIDLAAAWKRNNPGRTEKWKAENRERVNRVTREWQHANPDKMKAIRRRYTVKTVTKRAAYRLANLDRIKPYQKAWFAAHPGYIAEKQHVQRARRYQQKKAGGVPRAEWAYIKAWYGNVCAQCSATERITMDHFIPLILGGKHEWSNVWPLCKACNSRKKDKRPALHYPPHVRGMLGEVG